MFKKIKIKSSGGQGARLGTGWPGQVPLELTRADTQGLAKPQASVIMSDQVPGLQQQTPEKTRARNSPITVVTVQAKASCNAEDPSVSSASLPGP